MKKLSVWLTLLCCITVMQLSGCSGDGGSVTGTKTTDPVTRGTTPSTPLTSQLVSMMSPDTINHYGDIAVTKDGKTTYAMPSALFEKFGAGLIVTPSTTAAKSSTQRVRSSLVGFGGFDIVVLSDIILGIAMDVYDIVDGITGKQEQETQFDNLQDQLGAINAQIDALGAKITKDLDSTWSKLNLSSAQSVVFSANTHIDTMFNITDQTGFLYFSHQKSLIAACANIVATTGSSATCQQEQRNAYNNRAALNSEAAVFAASVTTKDVRNDVATIHSAIVPAGKIQIFKALVTKLLADNNPSISAPAKDNAMYAYLVLEGMFAQFLTYQYQGASMIVNADNYNDKIAGNPIGYNANNYMTGTFESNLREECAEFLAQVQWLVVNLHDYRDKDVYTKDMAFMNQGLAPDPVFSDILARARFFCAQVLQPYNDNRAKGTNGTWVPNTQLSSNVASNGFGLRGVIVVPGDYTKKNQLTLNFYDSNNKLVTSTTAKPTEIKGRYPYTKWGAFSYDGVNLGNLKAQAAYDWLVYDIDLSGTNLSAGTYLVRFVEEGKDPNGNTGPWVHFDTLLGTVNLQYYDPQNPAIGTFAPDSTHTRLFGHFSLYWPWNFQRFTSSPLSSFSDPSSSYAWTGTTTANKTETVSPSYPDYKGLVNQFTYAIPNSSEKSGERYLFIPFAIDTPNVKIMYNSTKNKVYGYFPSAYYMKSYSVGFSYSISSNSSPDTTNLIDSGTSPATDNGNPTIWTDNSAYQTIKWKKDTTTGLSWLVVYVNWNSSYKSGLAVDVVTNVTADLNWYMQLMFTDMKSVQDIQ